MTYSNTSTRRPSQSSNPVQTHAAYIAAVSPTVQAVIARLLLWLAGAGGGHEDRRELEAGNRGDQRTHGAPCAPDEPAASSAERALPAPLAPASRGGCALPLDKVAAPARAQVPVSSCRGCRGAASKNYNMSGGYGGTGNGDRAVGDDKGQDGRQFFDDKVVSRCRFDAKDPEVWLETAIKYVVS